MNKAFAITPVYDLLLRGSPDMPVGLYHLHIATAEQLCRLHYKAGMLKTVSKRLKVLVDNGFIQADCIPTKLFKSPYYYAVAYRGMRYLQDLGMDVDPGFRASKELSESYLHLRHSLELNDVLIAALRLKTTHPQYYLARYIQERSLKRQPYKNNGITLIPDGFLDIRQRQVERSLSLILEHDRGTEQHDHFRRRIRAYMTFLSTEGYRQMFQANSVIVGFTTLVSVKRIEQMRTWTYQELQGDAQLMKRFMFGHLPARMEPKHLFFERRWFTLADNQPIALLGEYHE